MHTNTRTRTTSVAAKSSKPLPAGVAYLALCLCLCACDASRVYEQYRTIPGEGWHKDSCAVFDVYISDSAMLSNLYINLRNTSAYPFCNIYLFVKVTAPSGAFTCDTVEYMLADQYGRWYGKGFAKVLDNRLTFRKHVRFPRSGVYRFEVQQGMRLDVLPYVANVGLRIEREHLLDIAGE
ncbi:MAG: gliding motility lipoprotein GldH [Prevotellaceae bacterium]|jgi:gliding motility-associated lipoprotein GldH|nr:gliding motility lipoprotein GldH [Prevotellaceae bacterium]